MTTTKKACYAISSGEYSDYHVVAVFSSKEKAEANLYLFPEGEIEEFPLDPEMPEASAGMLPFLCCSHYWDRKARQVVPGIHAHMSDHEEVVRNGQQVYTLNSTELSTYTWANEEEHAIKIAAERFARHQAI